VRVATSVYAQTPPAFRGEKRDCGVRALRVAIGRTYEDAHRILKAYGRVDKRGTYNNTMTIAGRMYGLEVISTAASGLPEKPTLAQFIRAHREGSYVIRINTHFVALREGVLHNWRAGRDGARSRVLMAWGRS
jgi:hypothetical protein